MAPLPACAALGVLLLGPAHSDVGQSAGTAPQPTQAPSVIVVMPFAVDAASVDSQPQGEVGGIIPHPLGILGRRHDSPQQAADTLANGMANLIADALQEDGLQAVVGDADSPELSQAGTWVMQGEFTQVDEGGNVRRALIGLGAGQASIHVNAWVELPGQEPFLLFTDKTGSGKMPGAFVMKFNPYVVAAKLVLSRNAPEKDARNAAGELAKKLKAYLVERGLAAAG